MEMGKTVANYLQVGYSFLPRKQAIIPPQYDVELLPGMLAPLSHLMKCVEMKWMCILDGPTASGKTSLVRALAQMTGHTLHEFAMNSSVDTTEILGMDSGVVCVEVLIRAYRWI